MRDDRELTPEQLAAFGAELDALRQRTLADLGADDARYIRRVRAAVRVCCWSGRALLMFGWLPPTWLLGSLLLGLGKILENMELGHNVMHGQYDWMNDPEFAGRAYEWDIAGPSDFWRHTHNHIHHTYTNVLGKDDDVGYGVVRLFPEQRWKPFYRWQPLWVTLQALLFQYAVAIQHLRLDKYAKGRLDKAELMPLLRRLRAKLGRQWTKDYLLFPLRPVRRRLWRGVRRQPAGQRAAQPVDLHGDLLRPLHREGGGLPALGAGGETRGHWYLRQLRGSSNLEGGPLFHILTGNLSHQIEHHLYPDLPARRYAALSREVREIARRYGQIYNSGRLGRQFLTVLRRIWVYRLPPRELPRGAQLSRRNARGARGGPLRSGDNAALCAATWLPAAAASESRRTQDGLRPRSASSVDPSRTYQCSADAGRGARPSRNRHVQPARHLSALYTATLLMLAGSGLFTTYIGLRLTQEGAGDLWVGGLMASYYFGLVCGGKFGHKLIASFGHIRSYVACAGIATVTVLLHALVDQLEVWLLLRFITGAVMMNQYMVIESWLNEQAESHQRGKVFAGYMVAVDLGLVLGQGLLALSPTLDYKPLLLVAICFASCLIPLAMTRRVHPAKLVAAPLEVRFFWQRVPQALGTIFIAGLMVGAFYGLAPVYANRNGLDASQSSFFVGMCIVAGFCAQWPLGWLSDRLDRSWLIRGNAVLLCLASIPMWGW